MPRLLRSSRRDRLPLFEQVRVNTLIDPYAEVRLEMGRHHDLDGNYIADQADQADRDPTGLRAESPEGWCEDRADPGSWDDPDINDEPWEG